MERNERETDLWGDWPAGGPGTVRARAGDLEACLTLTDSDRLGCLLERLELRPGRGAALSFEPARVAERLSYLGEALAVIEEDRTNGRAVLRSVSPYRDGENFSFFEMVLDRADGLSLTRQTFHPARGEREMTSAPLTQYALRRLMADLTELLSPR